MIVRFDNGVMVCDDDLLAADYRDDVGTARQWDIFNLAADDLRLVLRTVCDRLDGLRRAAPQGMHFDHIAAAHMRQQGADGDLLRRNGDVDGAGLHQFGI